MSADIGRLFRFAVVGVIGAAVHMGAFEAARRLLDWGYAPAWLFSFMIAATSGWILNRTFTFQAAASDANGLEWLRYVAVAGAGALAHFAVFALAIALSPFFARHPALAIVPGSLASLLVTYAGSALFVFASARKRP